MNVQGDDLIQMRELMFLLGVMYTKMAMKTKDVKREIKIGN